MAGILLTGLMIIIFSSCNLTRKYEQDEEEEISKFLGEHPELAFTLKESGLYFLDVTVGTGEKPQSGDTVYVYYTESFLDGTITYSNFDDDAFSFPAGKGYVIPGFDEGIMLMKEEGTAKMLVPSYLAYGNSGYIMPAYTPILYDVKLDSIVAGPR